MSDPVRVAAAGIGIVDTTSLAQAALTLSGEARKGGLMPGAEIEISVLDPASSARESFLYFLHNIMLYDELRTDFEVLETCRVPQRVPIRDLIRRLPDDVRVSPIPQTVRDVDIATTILRTFLNTVLEDPALHLSEDFFIARSMAGHHALMVFGPAIFREIKAFASHHRDVICRDRMPDEVSIILVRQLSTIVRTVKYSAHSQSLHARDRIPSVYCAQPRRIDLIRRYVSHEQVRKLEQGGADFINLFSQLGLAPSGYDFSIFQPDIKPLRLSDLSLALGHLPADVAFERVLELRRTPEALELRRIWAERLWSGGDRALEGMRQSMSNISAAGDVTQIIIGHVHTRGATKHELGKLIREGDAADLRRSVIQKLSAA